MTIAWIFAIVLVLGLIAAIVHERKLWNNGICAEYNEPWVHFDNDSQGGRGYKCRDRHIWISWPVDRKRVAVARARKD